MKNYLNTITVTLVNVTSSKYAFARPLAIIMVALMLFTYSNTQAAANDNCSNATVISSLPYTSSTQNNQGANTDNIPGGSGCGDHTRNLWYRVTGTGCTMTASTDFAATNFDTEIHVYTGSCGNFTEVACNDDAGSVWYLNAITSWPSVAGTTYFISVGYWTNSNVTGNFVLGVTSASVTPSVSISTPATTICQNASVTFTATPTNGGSNPTYQWRVNGSVVGSNSATYTTNNLANNAVVTCRLTNNSVCASPSTVTSNSITMTVNPNVTPTATVSASATNVCAGTTVNFTANITNGGTSPSYQWRVNGSNVGTNSSTFSSSSLTNGAQVSVVLTSNAACATSTTVTSAQVGMTINPAVTPTVSISSSATTICSGTSVTFNASASNAGSPSYQWKVNGSNVGANASSYTSSTLANGNVVTCVITSTASCASPSTATSNAVTVTVNPSVTPAVSIASSANNICSGTSVTFTATPTNGGTPSYQWRLNGSNVGSNSATYTSSALNNNDAVTCVMTSTANCRIANTATSNSINMSVGTVVTPTVSVSASATSVCTGTAVTFTATPTNGGTTPAYQWKVNGNNTGTNSAVFALNTPANNDVVSVVMTSNAACASSATATSNSTTLTVSNAVTANAGADVNVCGNAASLTANGGGTWAFIQGAGTIDNASNATINLSNLAAGTNQLVYTVAGGCNTASDTVTVTTMQYGNNIMHAQGVYYANRECTTADGWTNYYLDLDGVMNTGDEKLLLSLHKNGNDIGTVGVDSFELKVELTSGYGNFGHLINGADAPYVNNNVSSWVVMGRYWDVTPKIQPNTPVDVRFYFDSTDYADVLGRAAQMGWASISEEYADLSFYKVDGASGKDPNPANGHMGITSSEITIYDKTTAPTWSYSSFGNDHMAEYTVTTFSGGGGGFGGGSQGPLPVEMMYIQAEVVESTIQINWATALEINNDGFIVERSQDGATWTNIGWVNGNDNTTSVSTYSYTDNTAQANVLYYYRLKQMDNDGAFEYTQIVTAAITNGINNNSVSVEAVYPNPAVNNTNVVVSCNYDAPVSISVYNIQGALLGSFDFSAVQGKNVFSLDLTAFSAGNYFVSVSNGDFVSQHKLSITK